MVLNFKKKRKKPLSHLAINREQADSIFSMLQQSRTVRFDFACVYLQKALMCGWAARQNLSDLYPPAGYRKRGESLAKVVAAETPSYVPFVSASPTCFSGETPTLAAFQQSFPCSSGAIAKLGGGGA